MKYSDIVVPTWCNYPDPNHGLIGCWSLVGGLITSKEYCKNCDYFLDGELNNEEEIINNQITLRAYLDLLK